MIEMVTRPMYISSMSFGSQGETAYRAYAEAMARTDLLCINGEGGELPDLIGRYPRNRGQQIASGRFGVSALLATMALGTISGTTPWGGATTRGISVLHLSATEYFVHMIGPKRL